MKSEIIIENLIGTLVINGEVDESKQTEIKEIVSGAILDCVKNTAMIDEQTLIEKQITDVLSAKNKPLLLRIRAVKELASSYVMKERSAITAQVDSFINSLN